MGTNIKELYTKRAPRYDLSANLYYLIGFRENAYRKKAVDALELNPGDTVVELGCGTGLNFRYLQDAVGSEGHIIGVDLTPAMLDQARKRIWRHGWRNVDLIQSDASQFVFPGDIDGILSTFALSLMPDYEGIIRRSADALNEGGRLVIEDLKLTSGALSILNPLGILITKPFGGSYEAGQRRPWVVMQRYLTDVYTEEYYVGFVYLSAGIQTSETAR